MFPLGQVRRYHWEFDDDPTKATGNPEGCWPPLFKIPVRVTRNNCMNKRKKFSTRLAAGLLLAILIDTALQLVWKAAVLALPHDGSPWLNAQAVLRKPLFIFVIFLRPTFFG